MIPPSSRSQGSTAPTPQNTPTPIPRILWTSTVYEADLPAETVATVNENTTTEMKAFILQTFWLGIANGGISRAIKISLSQRQLHFVSKDFVELLLRSLYTKTCKHSLWFQREMAYSERKKQTKQNKTQQTNKTRLRNRVSWTNKDLSVQPSRSQSPSFPGLHAISLFGLTEQLQTKLHSIFWFVTWQAKRAGWEVSWKVYVETSLFAPVSQIIFYFYFWKLILYSTINKAYFDLRNLSLYKTNFVFGWLKVVAMFVCCCCFFFCLFDCFLSFVRLSSKLCRAPALPRK